MTRLLKTAAVSKGLLLLTLLTGCQTVDFPEVPEPLTGYKSAAKQSTGSDALGGQSTESTILSVQAGPPLPEYQEAVRFLKRPQVPDLDGQDLQINLANVALPAFINEVFGNTLGLNFTIVPELADREDRVTLRASQPQSPEDLYLVALQVLREYGVGARREDKLLTFYMLANGGTKVPLLISGRALPEVPDSHRPVFQFVSLKSVRHNDVQHWLVSAYGKSGLKVEGDQKRNTLVLMGRPDIVSEAVTAINALDRPFMRGRNNRIVSPVFIDVISLADRLVDILATEGYAAATKMHLGGAIILLPVEEANKLMMFAEDEKLLDHAVDWIRTLDQPVPKDGISMFFYAVENTKAESIAMTVNQVLGATSRSGSGVTKGKDSSVQSQSQQRLVIDEQRNSLIFSGEAAEWLNLYKLIRKLDVPSKQVLIEVTIAEVTLTDQENFGIEWFARGNKSEYGELISSQPGSGVSGGGLTAIMLDSLGQARLTLNAFASDSRVNLLSTPRILVQSGEEASIDIGTEIPIVTSTAEPTETIGRISQSIQYRKTGIILNVTPVVHSGNRVDLEISQEVSEALPVASGAAIQSPSVFKRKVETHLSLQDGGSVVIGGMISSRATESTAGIPYLKNIPFLGRLFKSGGTDVSRTELVMLIVPYVIENDSDAQAITDVITRQLDWLQPQQDEK